MNYFNILFYFILILSTMMVINSNTWLNSWMGLEINLMSFIPLMINFNKNMKISNSMMIYFITQAIASSLIIIGILMMKINSMFLMDFYMNLLQISLLMKLGMFPFYWWTPKMILNLNWMNTFIFLTWQKISPMILLMLTKFSLMIYMSIMISLIISSIMGMNQSLIKTMLMYSSIHHMSWMLMIIFLNMNLFIIYLMIYSLISAMICFYMKTYNYTEISQLFNNLNQDLNSKIVSISLFLSLAGLPPFLGFLPKFLSLILMIKMSLFLESMIFIIMSMISLSFYFNPLLSMFLMSKNNLKWNIKNKMNNKIMNNIMLINMTLMLMLMPIFNNKII